ncbi:hypothetical protein [Staphylococcus pseudoxylosus]|uniref:hypothetical protein n=1 Tax=Staphylococcus pseudoxylosus TaxID=2282419 RepID=UPI00398B8DB9
MFKQLTKSNKSNENQEDIIQNQDIPFESKQPFQEIQNKIEYSFKHLKRYNELAREIKRLANKITFFDNTDEFHESMNLKRQKKKLETELLELDDHIHSEKVYISDAERKQFNDKNEKEKQIISDKTTAAYTDFVKKSEQLADSYEKLVELRNEYEYRENQGSYVNSNIENLRGDLTTARKSLFNNRLGAFNVNPIGRSIDPKSMVRNVVIKHLWDVEDKERNK